VNSATEPKKRHPGRKPAHVLAGMAREQGRQVVWDAIRQRRTFTRPQLERDTRFIESTIDSYLQGLTAAGYLTVQPAVRGADGAWAPATYSLARDVGAVAPRVTRKGEPVKQGDKRQAQWQAMRILRIFTVAEIVSAASAGGDPVSKVDASDYIYALQKASYLRVVSEQRKGVVTRWQLVPARNTGPLSPQIQKIQQVFDQNLRIVVWPVQS